MQSNFLNVTQISSSGMSAERTRMEVIANNIANAQSSDSADGGPFRRQHVIFAEALSDQGLDGPQSMNGVQVVGIGKDNTEFERVYNPGHPHADEDGFVEMPNVKMPNEMIDLITASRAYEANLKALTAFKEMVEQTLSLLRGNR